MSDDNTPAVNNDDLDAFSTSFFGQNEDTPVTTKTEKEVQEDVHEHDAHEDAHSEPDDTGSEPDENDAGSEPDEKATKPKKTRFQERIDELTAKAREAERRAEAAEAKLKGQDTAPANKTQAAKPELVEPTPTDLNEDGTEKYELGEFDPKYIKDLTKFALLNEKAEMAARDAQEAKQATMNAEKEALEADWSEKLPTARERYPDFNEKGQALVDTFEGINAAYGEYLQATIMGLDNGTDVLYYLASNIDEANKIVSAGPAKATVMLAKIDSKFDKNDEAEAETKPVVRVSKAPTPPPQNRGVSAAKATIADDTDDLDAFSTKLFDKRYGKRR